MTYYKNLGGAYRRPNGEIVLPGGVFEPTEKEEGSMFAQMQIPIRFTAVEAPEVAEPDAKPDTESETIQCAKCGRECDPVGDDDAAVTHCVECAGELVGAGVVPPAAESGSQSRTDAWPLNISPRKYLQKHPKGKHAKLARQLVGK